MTIIFDGRSNIVGLDASFYAQDEFSTSNIDTVADPAGSGETVVRCILRSTDSQVSSGYRAEIASVGADTGRQSWPGTYWYWFSIYLTDNTDALLGWKQTVWQFHGPGSEAPMWFGELMADGALHISRNIIDGGSGTYDPMYYRIQPSRVKNKWLTFVVYAEWANAVEGTVKICWMGRK